jgi:hypothetical protein
MNDSWTTLILNLGEYSIFMAALAWLLRSLFSHWLTKDVEKYKSELKTQTDIAAERLRRLAYEHEVKFSRLHEERAEVIKKLYSLLVELATNAEQFFMPGSVGNRELEQATGEALKGFGAYFNQNKIYLGTELCGQCKSLLNLVRDAFTTRTVITGWNPKSEKDGDEWRKMLLEAYNNIRTGVPPIQKELEDEFRKILGVN